MLLLFYCFGIQIIWVAIKMQYNFYKPIQVDKTQHDLIKGLKTFINESNIIKKID